MEQILFVENRAKKSYCQGCTVLNSHSHSLSMVFNCFTFMSAVSQLGCFVEGARLESKTNPGWTALMEASLQGHVRIVNILLTAGGMRSHNYKNPVFESSISL